MAAAPAPDWFLVEWMRALNIRAADIVRETGWSKAKVSELVNGIQPYKRDIINEAARALNIHPYELLLPPESAMAIRRLRDDAVRIAHDRGLSDEPAAATARRSVA